MLTYFCYYQPQSDELALLLPASSNILSRIPSALQALEATSVNSEARMTVTAFLVDAKLLEQSLLDKALACLAEGAYVRLSDRQLFRDQLSQPLSLLARLRIPGFLKSTDSVNLSATDRDFLERAEVKLQRQPKNITLKEAVHRCLASPSLDVSLFSFMCSHGVHACDTRARENLFIMRCESKIVEENLRSNFHRYWLEEREKLSATATLWPYQSCFAYDVDVVFSILRFEEEERTSHLDMPL